jgi:hypothetical protein
MDFCRPTGDFQRVGQAAQRALRKDTIPSGQIFDGRCAYVFRVDTQQISCEIRETVSPTRRMLGIVIICFGAGCANSAGTWKESGYRQDAFGYEVAFRDKGAKLIAGPDWQIDNYRYDRSSSSWEEKTGANYVATREQDIDQDGTISNGEKVEEPIYDLKLANRKNNGVIWTKAHPFLPEDAEQDLEVILDNYADSLSGRRTLRARQPLRHRTCKDSQLHDVLSFEGDRSDRNTRCSFGHYRDF